MNIPLRIKGCILKYNQLENGRVCDPGCVKKDQPKVPVIIGDAYTIAAEPIGYAEIFSKDDGVYVECTINDGVKIPTEYTHFSFFANKLKYNNVKAGTHVSEMTIQCIDIVSRDKTVDTSLYSCEFIDSMYNGNGEITW